VIGELTWKRNTKRNVFVILRWSEIERQYQELEHGIRFNWSSRFSFMPLISQVQTPRNTWTSTAVFKLWISRASHSNRRQFALYKTDWIEIDWKPMMHQSQVESGTGCFIGHANKVEDKVGLLGFCKLIILMYLNLAVNCPT